MSIIDYITGAITVFAFIAGILNYTVIKPLKAADQHHQERWSEAKEQIMSYINEIRSNTNELVAQNTILRERMSADEMNTRNGMQRLDVLEKRVNELLTNCRNCRKEQ